TLANTCVADTAAVGVRPPDLAATPGRVVGQDRARREQIETGSGDRGRRRTLHEVSSRAEMVLWLSFITQSAHLASPSLRVIRNDDLGQTYPAPRMLHSVTAPAVLMRPILLPPNSANHTGPTGPAAKR